MSKPVGLERDGSVIWETESSDPEGAGNRYTAGEPPTDDELADIWAAAAARRVGSGHEEYVGGEHSFCSICGVVDQLSPGVDEWFHPEAIPVAR